MQFQGFGAAHGVEAEDEVDVGQEVTGGVHVQVLLEPPLGAGKVDLAAAREEEGDRVGGVGARGGVERGHEPGNLRGVGLKYEGSWLVQLHTLIELIRVHEKSDLKEHGHTRAVAICASSKTEDIEYFFLSTYIYGNKEKFCVI